MISINKNKLVLTLFTGILFISGHAFSNELSASPQKNYTTEKVQLDVYKSPTCGCCGKWIAHIEAEGLLTKTHNTNNLNQLKDDKGVPKNYRSCHTAVTKDGFIFEGHIPAKIVKRFLQEKPQNSIGLVVPGMPVGSPGMAYKNKFAPYSVLLIKKDGSLETYAQVKTEKEQFE